MFSVAGRDGLLPTISAYIHMDNMTPVIPCIVEGTLGNTSVIFIKKRKKRNTYISFSSL